jgi:hypothetical protein
VGTGCHGTAAEGVENAHRVGLVAVFRDFGGCYTGNAVDLVAVDTDGVAA